MLVTQGGCDTVAFEFIAGDLGLDFVNTREYHEGPMPEDVLISWRELVDWGAAAGLMSPHVAGALRALGAANPRVASTTFRLALRLRDGLCRILTGLIAGRPPAADDLRLLNERLAAAQATLVLCPTAGALIPKLPVTPERPETVLGPVVLAAARLFSSPEALALVRRCDHPTCRRFFVDRSKNRSRRWCDMKICGNRIKAREHYRRSRPTNPAGTTA
jgi:predicted RNA-binding Zn ribbon-like protein